MSVRLIRPRVVQRRVSDLAFRLATTEDVAAVVAIVNAAYREGGGRAWTTERDLVAGARIGPDGLVALLARPGNAVLVAHRGGRLVGCVHVARADATPSAPPGARADECVLGMLSVDPAEQASGVGRALVAEAERVARERFGARVMSMRVIPTRAELVAWYERRGYARTGVVVPFVPPPGVTFPRGPLVFERLEKRLDA